MGLDAFGRMVRDIRLVRAMLLYDMAKDLNISPAELSAIECGRKPVPDWFISKLQEKYGISDMHAQSLIKFMNERGEKNCPGMIEKNAEGYSDPTAYQALKNIEAEEERFHKLLYAIFDICELADFEIEGRIVLVDKRSGKVWR